MSEQAVIVHLRLPSDGFGSAGDHDAVYALEDAIERCLMASSAGEFDGDEFGEGECVLYLYGLNADELFSAIKPLLESSTIASGGFAVKRYGEPGDLEAKTVRVTW